MSTQQDEDHLQSLPSPISHHARQGECGRDDMATRHDRSVDDDDDLDELESILSAKSKKDATLRQFFRDYAHFKTMTNPALLIALIRCTVLNLSGPACTGTPWKPGEQSFSSELRSLRIFLRSGDLESVRLW